MTEGCTKARFANDLKQALQVARLAPSSHNSQPWLLKVIVGVPVEMSDQTIDECDHFLSLGFDDTRTLTSMDSLQPEMFISLGGFWHMLRSMLDALGYRSDIFWQPETNQALPASVAIVRVRKERPADNDALERIKASASRRLTNRGPYQASRLESIRLKPLFDSDSAALNVIDEPMMISRIANLVKRYAGLDFSNTKAWSETWQYIRFDEKEPAEDGFYLSNLFGPVSRLTRFLFEFGLNPKRHWLYRPLGVPGIMAGGLADLVRNTPQLFTVTVEQNSPEAWFSAGTSLIDFWLSCARQGIAIHPVSVLLQNEEPKHNLQRVTGDENSVVFIGRIGFPQQQAQPAPRRSVDSVLT